MAKKRDPKSPKNRLIRSQAVSRPVEQPTRRKLVPAKLADKLRRIRVRHHKTQGEMLLIINPAEHDDNNRARVSQYERKLRIPSLVEVFNYARFAGVEVELLLNDDLDLPPEYDNF